MKKKAGPKGSLLSICFRQKEATLEKEQSRKALFRKEAVSRGPLPAKKSRAGREALPSVRCAKEWSALTEHSKFSKFKRATVSARAGPKRENEVLSFCPGLCGTKKNNAELLSAAPVEPSWTLNVLR
ncbi:hypothetical protein NDU88_008450 [Pleurodeles waltl]|uniref:Uncharacterized protein n=1 Tax=Pleurodeles waltl TaxID=8319 RepID=A0AAV7QUN4_PLEWA|nr:hypothetical protein NDU88_008450 [Pleurodeles waltl]